MNDNIIYVVVLIFFHLLLGMDVTTISDLTSNIYSLRLFLVIPCVLFNLKNDLLKTSKKICSKISRAEMIAFSSEVKAGAWGV